MASCNLRRRRRQQIWALTVALAEEASWCYVVVLITLLLLRNRFKEACTITNGGDDDEDRNNVKEMVLCDEIYVVGEGETLNTIGDKCGDPFIVEHNPHNHVPDDVLPGFVLKIRLPTLG
ncbi:hypothetical protein Golax_005490, partial [Gossypium laxum]|nr:hypothetical protein [Gossypium laxum]